MKKTRLEKCILGRLINVNSKKIKNGIKADIISNLFYLLCWDAIISLFLNKITRCEKYA